MSLLGVVPFRKFIPTVQDEKKIRGFGIFSPNGEFVMAYKHLRDAKDEKFPEEYILAVLIKKLPNRKIP